VRSKETLQLALDVHAQLTALVAPASPDSIRASVFFKNYALLLIALIGLASFVVFLVPALVFPKSVQNVSGAMEIFRTAAAAGFGAAFYSLYTATPYLRDGTFEPKYNQVYLIRFVLGVFAGVILANFATDLLDTKQFSFGVTTLALVGGYSAEAVAQTLQRVADTLVTLVRGNASDRAEAEAAKEKAQSATKITAILNDALNAQGNAQQEKIRQAIAQLLK